MEIHQLLQFSAQWVSVILALASVVIIGCMLHVRYRPGLRDIPGPFWASMLPLDRILTAISGRQFLTHIEYHQKYGPLVRVGPNHVSFSDADLIPLVYGITSKFCKVRGHPYELRSC